MKILYFENTDNLVEIRDATNQCRVAIKKNDLLHLIKNEVTEQLLKKNISCEDEKDLSSSKTMWIKYNWQDSLEYYLWSRRSSFYDSATSDKKRFIAQTNLLQEYIKKSKGYVPLPRKISNANNNVIQFPEYMITQHKTVGQTLYDRSCSNHQKKSTLQLSELGYILSKGLSDIKKYRFPTKKNFIHDLLKSFGRSFEFFIISYDDKLLNKGVYFYDPHSHNIELIKLGDFRNIMKRILIGHDAPEYASCSIVMVENYEISQWQYRHERALRNLFFESGRIMQRLLVASASINKQTHITPAAIDSLALKLLELDREKYQIFYTLTLS